MRSIYRQQLTVHSSKFKWDGAKRQFTAEASEVGVSGFTFWMVSQRTGKEAQFKLVRTEKDPEGEILWCEYEGPGCVAVIYND